MAGAQPDTRLRLPGPPVLAVGAWFACTPRRVIAGDVYGAGTAGDLIDADACRRFDAAVAALSALGGEAPCAIAHDLHPDFHSTRAARALAERLGLPAIAVQHHHAHLAAVLAEHGSHAAVVGLAADGVGLGTDGTAWGGELLQVDGARCRRLGHLRALPLPGGDKAAQAPWRMAAAVLHLCGRSDEIAHRFGHQTGAGEISAILTRPRLSPPTTSLGRHFDAAAALLGLCEDNTHHAAAPIALEQAAQKYGHGGNGGNGEPLGHVSADARLWRRTADGTLDLLPLLASLIDEPDPARGAARFHATLSAALAEWLIDAAHAMQRHTVALGGGCFHNRLLSDGLCHRLAAGGLTVLRPQRLAPGDADLAIGQAWVAQRALRGN